MSVIDIIKESLTYPTKDIKNWMIIGVIFIIIAIFNLPYMYSNSTISGISGIITLIITIFLMGISIGIIKNTIEGNDNFPGYNISTNFIDGIKGLILSIVYFIIPFIITLIVAWASGFFSSAIGIISNVASNPLFNQTLTSGAAFSTTTVNTIINTIPTTLLDSLFNSLIITGIVGIILFIIFSIFSYIGLARLAETGSIKAGISIGEVFKKIGSIGWGKYIGWYILLLVVSAIIVFIGGLIMGIPYVGSFINALLFTSLVFLFESRAIGLIYKE